MRALTLAREKKSKATESRPGFFYSERYPRVHSPSFPPRLPLENARRLE